MPSVCFRNALRDSFGNLLLASERLSQILPKSDGRSYVFVLDSIDSVSLGEDMRRFLKTIAEDSHLTRSYVVLVFTSDASNARTMWEWNGHEQIVMMNDLNRESPLDYRWDAEDIKEWLVKYAESNDESLLKEADISAGTPGFLVENVQSTRDRYNVWSRRALFKNEQWINGGKELE